MNISSLSRTSRQALCAFTLSAFSSLSYAEIITFEAVGYVQSVSPELSNASIEPGDPIEITYTFDSNTADSNPSEDLGRYYNAVLGATFQIGDFVATSNTGQIAVQDDAWFSTDAEGNKIYGDAYWMSTYSVTAPQIDGLDVYVAGFNYVNLDTTIFDSDSLPLDPPQFDYQDAKPSIDMRWGMPHSSPKVIGVLQNIILVKRAYTVSELLNALIYKVMSYNYQSGNMNSFDSKLQGVASALEDTDKKDYNTALNKLGSFINEVESHSGKSLTYQQADELINAATEIINAIKEQ